MQPYTEFSLFDAAYARRKYWTSLYKLASTVMFAASQFETPLLNWYKRTNSAF
jgi:hypothetical protein